MTPQPEPEYIITESQLQAVVKLVRRFDVIGWHPWFEQIHSRHASHSSAPAAEKIHVHNICKLCPVPFGSDECDSTPEECFATVEEHDAAVAADATRKVLDKCCKECPVHEEIPVEDYCAESCEGCLVRKVCMESLRGLKDSSESEEPSAKPRGGK